MKMKTSTYICYTKKEDVRKNSSSGGIFYELAKHMIEQENAVVYGAGFDTDFSVVHMRAENVEDMKKLMRSKYVQSDMADNFLRVKEDLMNGRQVLFVGTPCQVKGLHQFLNIANISAEQLTTVDFVCHGVPSPQVWKDYLHALSMKSQSGVKDVNFRDKRNGWHDYCMKISFENKKEYVKSHYTDEYMFYYLRDYMMRDSCYQCHFRTAGNRASDITIADAWTAEREPKKLDRGKSQVFVNTEKGEQLLQNVTQYIYIYIYRSRTEEEREEDIAQKADYQKKMELKDRFFKDYQKTGFSKEFRKKYYGGKNLMKNKIKHFLYQTGIGNKIK